jgi:Helix-turn-helix of DDE superfamily endonuclease
MKHQKLEKLTATVFRRITGVKRKTFAVMVEIIIASDKKRLKGEGRRPKLPVEDQILMTLEYLREYRTYAHIGVDYGVGESSAFRIIRRTENALVSSRKFALPNRKNALNDPSIVTETIDCTESPVERPQKNSADTTRERKNAIQSKRNSL